VEYERFREEVLEPLRTGKSFSYRPFACSTFTLSEPVQVMPKRLSIVEGTYSQHPYFGDAYDLRIVLTVTPETQRERISRRPAFLHKRFFEEWIPMEEMYFEHFGIRNRSDLVL
jgi:uridine kinase